MKWSWLAVDGICEALLTSSGLSSSSSAGDDIIIKEAAAHVVAFPFIKHMACISPVITTRIYPTEQHLHYINNTMIRASVRQINMHYHTFIFALTAIAQLNNQMLYTKAAT